MRARSPLLLSVFLWSLGQASAAAQCGTDAFEPNDVCTAAAVVTIPSPPFFTLQDLSVSLTDEDWFSIQLPPARRFIGQSVRVAPFAHDLLVEGYSACGTPLVDETASRSFVHTNTSALPETLLLRVVADPAGVSPADQCYRLNIDMIFQPCLQVDDTLSGLIGPGAYTDLVLLDTANSDEYLIDLQDGDRLNVTGGGTAQLRFRLYDANCGTTPLATSTQGVAIQFRNETGDSMRLRWVIAPEQSGACAKYNMNVSVTSNGPSLMGPFCFGSAGSACGCLNPSSTANFLGAGCLYDSLSTTGFFYNGALLSASGTTSISQNSLHLTMTGPPAGSLAILVSGQNKLPKQGLCRGTGIPFFDGTRCIGGDFRRHGQASNGWSNIATNSGFTVGQTRYFQVFYRSNFSQACSGGLNSSNGYHVTFQP